LPPVLITANIVFVPRSVPAPGSSRAGSVHSISGVVTGAYGRNECADQKARATGMLMAAAGQTVNNRAGFGDFLRAAKRGKKGPFPRHGAFR
jgi:hypothetical protein